jgi:hypothetical protein
MTEHQQDANWNVAEWHGKMLVDRDGERIGKLQDVYVDVENDEPQFATVKEGFIGRHLTFVPLGGITVGPDDLQVGVSKEQIRSAPNIAQHGEELSQADESALYHHYELNYTPPSTESGWASSGGSDRYVSDGAQTRSFVVSGRNSYGTPTASHAARHVTLPR